MIFNLIQIIITMVVFFTVKFLVWKITDEWGLPMWLQYKPYICYLCLGFWSLLAIYLTSGLILHMWITMAVGVVLTILDAIAQVVNQKNNTIKI